ncbi:restriction endonuclease subunit S [Psychrobacter sp. AOP22-C1-C5]|uniref:restriction endonuclease subunit S n=1 Tax=Psychrobacter sp. AOP22-C1-C5 TaxID=3457716 RepID=UPI0040369D37
MTEVKIPEGYKQTEVGVIPKDWEVEPLKSLLKEPPKYGINAAAVPLTGNLPVYIRITDISEDGYYSPEKVVGVNSPFSSSYILNEGDIVLARTGASVGKSYLYRKEDGTLIYAGFLIKVSPNEKQLNPKYLHQYLKTEQYWAWVIVNSMRSGQPGINGNEYGRLLIPLPSIEEQTAIATALSDVDDLIQSLEKLIAKKEAIKTGTMQQLLTGKTRLPEFATREDGNPKGFKQTELGRIPEDWETINFDELLEPTISKKPIKPSTLVTFIGMQDVTGNAQLANQTVVSHEKVKNGFTYFENGDVLLAKITPCFENGKGCHTETLKTKYGFGSTEFHVLRATEYSDSKFIYFWTTRNSFRIDLESTMVGSAGHRRVPLSAVKSYQIPCPTSKSEQTAIATILSDMDAEIQALQQRLEKTKDIKQGMMQQLLTGKVRLAH